MGIHTYAENFLLKRKIVKTDSNIWNIEETYFLQPHIANVIACPKHPKPLILHMVCTPLLKVSQKIRT